ncbi:MAG: carbon storage regulator [Thermoguttaceae bacterium]
MLILSRKSNQTILLGNEIRIVVISSRKGQVQLGIEAPKNMLILRGELPDAVRLQALADEERAA